MYGLPEAGLCRHGSDDDAGEYGFGGFEFGSLGDTLGNLLAVQPCKVPNVQEFENALEAITVMNVKKWIAALPKGAMLRIGISTTSDIIHIEVVHDDKRTSRFTSLKRIESAKGDVILEELEAAAVLMKQPV